MKGFIKNSINFGSFLNNDIIANLIVSRYESEYESLSNLSRFSDRDTPAVASTSGSPSNILHVTEDMGFPLVRSKLEEKLWYLSLRC